LLAALAGARASRPFLPRGQDAVNRASLLVAIASLHGIRAGLATVLRGNDHMATTRLRSAAATFGAGTPLQPVSLYTIDWASLSVAFLSLHGCGTFDTAMGGTAGHLAVTRPDSATTCLCAGRPASKLGDDAVNRTRMAVAAIILQ